MFQHLFYSRVVYMAELMQASIQLYLLIPLAETSNPEHSGCDTLNQ